MKIIYNDKLLNNLSIFMQVAGITLYPFIILKERYKGDKVILNHERIHAQQQKELLVVFFYIWYVLEFILKGFSYHRISFEKESYKNEDNPSYLETRKSYSYLRHIGYSK